jgi:hypothetical protein
MSFTKSEKTLIKTLQEAIKSKDALGNIDLNHQNEIGFMLSYYLKGILEKNQELVIKQRWIDCVEWKTLQAINSNQIEGVGRLWWGFRDDVSKTFPEDFYCEMELKIFEMKTIISYFFQFQIDGKKYKLKN